MTQLIRNREDDNASLWSRMERGEEGICVVINGGVFICYDPHFESDVTTPGFSFMWADVDHGCAQIGCAFGYCVDHQHFPVGAYNQVTSRNQL